MKERGAKDNLKHVITVQIVVCTKISGKNTTYNHAADRQKITGKLSKNVSLKRLLICSFVADRQVSISSYQMFWNLLSFAQKLLVKL